MVTCLELDADLHMAQLMPLPLTVSCFSKIQIGFTFLVPAHPGSPGKRAVCVYLFLVDYNSNNSNHSGNTKNTAQCSFNCYFQTVKKHTSLFYEKRQKLKAYTTGSRFRRCIANKSVLSLRTSALSMTRPAARAPAASIDICCPRPGCDQRQLLVDRTDGRTDRRTADRCT